MRTTTRLGILIVAATCGAVRADDAACRVTFANEQGATRAIEGQILVTAADGGLLVEDRAGELFNVTPDRLESSEELGKGFEFFNSEELARHLRDELGGEPAVVTTRHYVIVTTGGQDYATWVGKLFERLLRGFMGYWRRAGLDLDEPAGPLPAIVFGTQREFAEFATRDAGPQLADKAGYFSIRTNRIALFDFAGGAAGNEINRRAAAAPANVSTIVHEATHQIAYACGLHLRYADTPMWLAEGLAMYFETPDLRTGSGWGTIGRLNQVRLQRFKEFANSGRGSDSLVTLVSSEDRFRDPQQIIAAYDESWALTYFLIRNHRDEYVAYLRTIAAKPRLVWDSKDERIEEFEAAFGDMGELEPEFSAYVARLGRRSRSGFR